MSAKIINITVPYGMDLRALDFLSTSVQSGSNNEDNEEKAVQAVVDAFNDPDTMVQRILLAAMISAQNRSNMLYKAGLDANAIEFKESYMKYASKYADKVARLAEAFFHQKSKSTPQNIVVKHINIEHGANAIVGNIATEREE